MGFFLTFLLFFSLFFCGFFFAYFCVCSSPCAAEAPVQARHATEAGRAAGGSQQALFLSADGLRYRAGGDHIQQVFALPIRQTRRFVASDPGVQVGDVNTWGKTDRSHLQSIVVRRARHVPKG